MGVQVFMFNQIPREMNVNTTKSSLLNVEVSCFRDYVTEDNPATISLITWLTSAKYRVQVERIRKETDKAKRDALKAHLPAITPSGTFTKRAASCLVKHSGFIGIDIDWDGNKHIGNYADLKQQITKIRNIAYCGISVSGTGYFALIPISDPTMHLQHFLALEKAFSSLGITIDHKCKDVSRLRGYSFDEDPYFNDGAAVFTGTYSEPRPHRVQYAVSGDNDASRVESCLNQLTRDITGDYGVWFELGCALATTFGEVGRNYFHQVSRFYDGYTVRGTDHQYDACLKGYQRITVGTFFHHLKSVGIEPERPAFQKSDKQNVLPKIDNNEYDLAGNLIDPLLGYPVTWKVESSPTPPPLQRLTEKYPLVNKLIQRFQLTPI